MLKLKGVKGFFTCGMDSRDKEDELIEELALLLIFVIIKRNYGKFGWRIISLCEI